MKRDEMVLNGTSLSLSVCAQGIVVLRSRRDAAWTDSFRLAGERKE